MARGDVLLVNLPASRRREQSGRRPVVAVQTDIVGEPMLMSLSKQKAVFMIMKTAFLLRSIYKIS